MTSVPESSKDTGPMLPGFETCETATGLWPTPSATPYGSSNNYQINKDQPAFNKPSLETMVRRGASPPLTSSAGASPASPSATPASERANPIAAGFGPSSTESYARFNPDGSLLRTCQDYVQSTLDGSLEEYSGTFPKQGSMRSGRLFPLPTSAPPTSESESSLWPTPDVPSGGRGIPKDAVRTGRSIYTKDGRKVQEGLANAVKWPTPAGEGSRSGGHQGLAGGTGNRLKLYGMLGYEEGKKMGCQSLNPYWVEWLMGFPLGWTDLGDSATPSFRRSRK